VEKKTEIDNIRFANIFHFRFQKVVTFISVDQMNPYLGFIMSWSRTKIYKNLVVPIRKSVD